MKRKNLTYYNGLPGVVESWFSCAPPSPFPVKVIVSCRSDQEMRCACGSVSTRWWHGHS